MTTDDALVLCCRGDRAAAAGDPVTAQALAALGSREVHFVGQRPGREIDALLSSAGATAGAATLAVERVADAGTRVLVLGDDGDLASVVLRVLRRDLLERLMIGYATGVRSQVTALHSLPLAADAVRLGLAGDPDLVVLVRDDSGGVLMGRAELTPVEGTVYVDEFPLLRGRAAAVVVDPHQEKGVEVSVLHRRVLGFGRRPRTRPGRAVEIGSRTPTTVISDGVVRARPVDRWTFYRHTTALRLIRGVIE